MVDEENTLGLANARTERKKPVLLDLRFNCDAQQQLYEAGDVLPERLAALYGKQTHMLKLARPMVKFRPWVIDYFEQCPALPLWIAPGINNPNQVPPKAQETIAWCVASLFSERPKLRDIMRRYGITKPIRGIQGSALLPRHAKLLRMLCEMNPSMLAQAIPNGAKKQRRWLNVLDWASRQTALASRLSWFVREVGHRRQNEAFDMGDMMRRAPFDMNWTWAQAERAQERWHMELADKKLGPGADDVICENPMPDEVEIEGFSFVALRTKRAIHLEGKAMHHCVASYASRVRAGLCSIVSMKSGGQRLVTIELTPSLGICQMRGPCNDARFPAKVNAAASLYNHAYRNAILKRDDTPLADRAGPSANHRRM